MGCDGRAVMDGLRWTGCGGKKVTRWIKLDEIQGLDTSDGDDDEDDETLSKAQP